MKDGRVIAPAKCRCGKAWSAVSLDAFEVTFRCVLCWLREYRPGVLAKEE